MLFLDLGTCGKVLKRIIRYRGNAIFGFRFKPIMPNHLLKTNQNLITRKYLPDCYIKKIIFSNLKFIALYEVCHCTATHDQTIHMTARKL